MSAARRVAAAAFALATIVATARAEAAPARAEDEILAPKTPQDGFRLESIETALSTYDQDGHGYQSQAGQRTAKDPGSERMTVFQPQALVVVKQGERLTHQLQVPIDVITSASTNAIDKTRAPDMISNASRKNESIAFDLTSTYAADKQTNLGIRTAFHLEEDFRAWTSGLSVARSLADDATTLQASAFHIYDWFDKYDITGKRDGRTTRVTTNGNVGITQVLTPTTIAHLDYGISGQSGALGNTWNSVPLVSGVRGSEQLPSHRVRHAAMGRFAQWLPWNGALKGSYRFYVDNWGIVAHTVEGQLLQRMTPWLYAKGSYRFHTQTGADFFTTLSPLVPPSGYRTADSDLAPLDSHSLALSLHADTPPVGRFRSLAFELSYERYFRTNDLSVNMWMWQTAFRF